MQPLADNANIPAFLGKLWKMVNDPNTDQFICWSPSGNSFIIQNQAQFWYELLPLYYKHNNMSSFVRQLNMYGFHKISSVENGTMDADKDEIQFYHPFFQKHQPEKLKNIKRKGTTTKGHDGGQTTIRHDDLTRVLTDVKQLRGRQSSVDSQLSAMKQENAVLWRELALLRQKHMRQQQIVNKLIQFLVTLVQPSASARMGVGVKRRMPLMLHESPSKRVKTKKPSHHLNGGGPTIHELKAEVDFAKDDLLDEAVGTEDIPLVDSPATPASSLVTASSSEPENTANSQLTNPNLILRDETSQDTLDANFPWDKPDFVNLEGTASVLSDNEEDLINTLQNNANSSEKIFMNPNSRDTLIGSLVNSGAYNTSVLGEKNFSNVKKQVNDKNADNLEMAVDVRNNTGRTNECFRDDLDLHVDSTQSELDQLKDILNGCTTFDANALLGLFSDPEPDYGLRNLQSKDNTANESVDPMVSGSEIATTNNLITFDELFDDSLNSQDADTDLLDKVTANDCDSTICTPDIKTEPIFPSTT